MDTILYNMMYTVLQWNTVRYSGIQCDTVLQWNTVRYSDTVEYSGLYCDTVRPGATVEYMSAKTVEMTH